MPVTIEDKIELFSKMIFGSIEAESSDRRQKLEKKYQAELIQLEKDIQDKRTELINAANTKADRERIRLLAQVKTQEQQRSIEVKQKMINRIMTILYGYSAKLSNTEDYKAILSKAVDNVSEGFSQARLIHFHVLPNEIDVLKQVLQEKSSRFAPEFKYIIEAAPLNILGGFIAEDKEKLLEIDLTLKTLVEEYRDTVGAAITRKFNEVSSI